MYRYGGGWMAGAQATVRLLSLRASALVSPSRPTAGRAHRTILFGTGHRHGNKCTRQATAVSQVGMRMQSIHDGTVHSRIRTATRLPADESQATIVNKRYGCLIITCHLVFCASSHHTRAASCLLIRDSRKSRGHCLTCRRIRHQSLHGVECAM